MSIGCNRCEETGFINTHQIDDDSCDFSRDDIEYWIESQNDEGHDVMECDCCDGSGQHQEKIFDCM